MIAEVTWYPAWLIIGWEALTCIYWLITAVNPNTIHSVLSMKSCNWSSYRRIDGVAIHVQQGLTMSWWHLYQKGPLYLPKISGIGTKNKTKLQLVGCLFLIYYKTMQCLKFVKRTCHRMTEFVRIWTKVPRLFYWFKSETKSNGLKVWNSAFC